jgi:RNA polymerase sigma factor (sigma-70 family)
VKKDIREQARIIASKFGKTYDQRQDIEGRCLEAAWLAESKLDEVRNPKAYIDRAMKNAAIDYLRDEKRAEVLPLHDELEIEDPNLEKSTIDSVVPDFINSLESPDKEILTLIVEGLSLEEIGKQLNLRPNSIAVRLHRNKKIWKDKLKL